MLSVTRTAVKLIIREVLKEFLVQVRIYCKINSLVRFWVVRFSTFSYTKIFIHIIKANLKFVEMHGCSSPKRYSTQKKNHERKKNMKSKFMTFYIVFVAAFVHPYRRILILMTTNYYCISFWFDTKQLSNCLYPQLLKLIIRYLRRWLI